MKDKKPNSILKIVIICVTYTMLLMFVLLHFQETCNVLTTVFTVLSPIIYGLMIAFILNYPYEFCYNKLFKKIGIKHPKLLLLRKVLSILCTYVFVIAVIAFLIVILVPQLADSMTMFIKNLPGYLSHFSSAFSNASNWINATFGLNLSDTNSVEDFAKSLFASNETGLNSTSDFLNIAITSIWDFLHSVYNLALAVIVSVYVIATKEKLFPAAKRFTKAYVPVRFHAFLRDVKLETYHICGKFIIGKIIDSAIIGVICFICMSIFGFDYPVLISVFVGITNIIPFFGPFIGAIPSAFLLLIVDPMQCLWFILFIFLLQQLDGNLIGPRIVGDKIGISGLWVLIGVLVGGGLFGLTGLIFGVPVCAVIYALLAKAIGKRLKLRHLE